MFQRILAVWMTYRTRKLLWVLGLGYVVFMAMAFAFATPSAKKSLWSSLFLQRDRPQLVFESFEEFTNWNPSDSELRRLRSLIIVNQHPKAPPPRSPLNGVRGSGRGARGEGENARSATHPDLVSTASASMPDALFKPQDIERLSKCIALRDLKLSSIDLTPELGKALAKLHYLSKLDLSLTESSSLDNLPPLENLKTLTLVSPKPNELGLLERHSSLRLLKFKLHHVPLARNADEVDMNAVSVGKLTQLEGLVVNHLNNKVSDSIIGEIAKLPNLRHISIDPQSPSMDAKIRRAIAGRTPAVWVQPMTDESMTNYLRIFSVVSMILFLIVGLQLFSQIVPFWARTVPDFSTPHLIIAVLLVLLHITLCFLLCLSHGEASILVCLFAALITPATALLCSLIAFRFKRSFLTMMNLTPIIAFVLVPMIFIRIQQMAGPTWTYSFAIGEQPSLALSMILVCLGIISFGIYRWSRAAVIMAEHGVTYNGDYQALTRFLQSVEEIENTDSSMQPSRSRLDRGIERIENSQFLLTTTIRISQWNLCYRNDFSKIRSAFPFLAIWLTIITVMFAAIVAGLKLKGDPIDLQHLLVGVLFVGMWSAPMHGLGNLIVARQRRPFLSQELLRPCARSTMSQCLFWSFGWQLWPSILLSIGSGIGLSQCTQWIDPEFSSTSYLVLRIGVVCLVTTLAIWLNSIFILTLPLRWQRDFLGTPILIFLGMCLQWGHIGFVSQSTNVQLVLTPWLICLVAIVSIVLGIVGIRRLPHVEWGRD